MVRQVMMPFGDSDVIERTIAALVGDQEGRDARRVRLEREEEHVVH